MPEETFEIAYHGFTASQSWNAYNWVIGFLVTFRAQRAYSRWWEGGTLLQQARGEWFNAYSSIIAFCTHDPQMIELTQKFQKTIARLISILHASALMSVATADDFDFEIIDATGLSEDHLSYLRTQKDKCEILMQWIQRLIVDNMENGVLPIPPPVLSRVFQELSRGIVNIHNVRKITEFQFPFPAAQMVVTMLVVQWTLTPVMSALLMSTPIWAFFVAFFPVFACWGINYIAQEIEQPFGDDFNDMPLHLMQSSLNLSILALLDKFAQNPPEFNSRLEQAQSQRVFNPGVSATVKEYHALRSYSFSQMRSVRYVTIQNPEQKLRRQFSADKNLEKEFKRAYSRSSLASKDMVSENVDVAHERPSIPHERPSIPDNSFSMKGSAPLKTGKTYSVFSTLTTDNPRKTFSVMYSDEPKTESPLSRQSKDSSGPSCSPASSAGTRTPAPPRLRISHDSPGQEMDDIPEEGQLGMELQSDICRELCTAGSIQSMYSTEVAGFSSIVPPVAAASSTDVQVCLS